MDKKIQEFIEKYKAKDKKRFGIIELENYVIEKSHGAKNYLALGGYDEFYKNIIKFRNEGKIKEINSSDYNGMNPALKLRWEIIYSEEQKWDNNKILKYSDSLDFGYYVNNPKYQNDKEWEYIENIYKFLKERDYREWASVEERSLELFNDEKFLTNKKDRDKGKYGILSRLKLDFVDLKMKKYGEMFIYWNRGIKNPKNIIILENHSTFFSYKRIAEKDLNIFNFTPDILIYGEGKKIENSFSFIEEIADMENIKVLYFGDVDIEGFGIYYRLKERYPNIDINLQKEAYVHLLELCNREYPNPVPYDTEHSFCHTEVSNCNFNVPICYFDAKGQRVANNSSFPLYLNFFIKEMGEFLDKNNLKKLIYIYNNNLRIPQELINYEYLLKVIQ